MDSQAFVFGTPTTQGGVDGLQMSAKRYTKSGTPPDGCTLIFLHALGQHKEQWEPTIEKIFDLASTSSSHRIREAWAFDWQTHGESAVLNEALIQDNAEAGLLSAWASALAAFMQSDVVRGQQFVGIGFSSGTVALTLTTKLLEISRVTALVLIEPSMMDQDTYETNTQEVQGMMDMVSKAVYHRLDSWASKDAALAYFLERYPWNTWDPRIVQLYAEHALRESVDQSGIATVKRKCPAIQEASVFKGNLVLSYEAMSRVTELCGVLPIHIIFGESVDLLPQVIRDCVVDTTKGRHVSTVTRIPDVGHMIVQEQPDIVASTIVKLLTIPRKTPYVAKL